MMHLEFRTHLGKRVVALGGTGLGSLRAWLAGLDLVGLKAKEGMADALLLDFRAQGFTPSARDAATLVSALRVLCARRMPPVAILANAGAQYGGARMLCTLGGMDGCRTAAFRDETEAWSWLHAQLECADGAVPSLHAATLLGV
jgi:hypothetical protein